LAQGLRTKIFLRRSHVRHFSGSDPVSVIWTSPSGMRSTAPLPVRDSFCPLNPRTKSSLFQGVTLNVSVPQPSFKPTKQQHSNNKGSSEVAIAFILLIIVFGNSLVREQFFEFISSQEEQWEKRHTMIHCAAS